MLSVCYNVHMHVCVPTFKDQVGFGNIQLVPKRYTSFLHSGARFKLHTNLQLITKNKTKVIIKQ